MATFLLVHGGLHGGWCWDALAPCLIAQGHTVLAPDLPGMGASAIPASDATLAGWADFIIGLARAQAMPPVLVGHSRGGIVLSAVAERAPEVCAGLVYVTAMLLQSGESMMSYAAAHMSHVGPAVSVGEDSINTNYDSATAHRIFYNRTDPAISEAAFARLCPEPVVPNVTPLQISDKRFGSVRRAYIECSDDSAVPLSVQRHMLGRLPCDPVITLDSDHSPFLSQPQALADALLAIAGGWQIV